MVVEELDELRVLGKCPTNGPVNGVRERQTFVVLIAQHEEDGAEVERLLGVLGSLKALFVGGYKGSRV